MKTPSKETLDIFGKILYALAMADGAVQDSEIEVIHEVVNHNKWASQIKFSFDLAHELDMDPKIIFLKNMRVFRTKALAEHYPYFLNLMEKVAEAHDGIVPEERVLIDSFKSYFEDKRDTITYTHTGHICQHVGL